jgi:hypothetical protein
MTNDHEQEAARLGMQALDGALVALGQRPVSQNPDFRLSSPVVGELPNVVLEKHGAAPLRFVLGPDLDVWVGPFSEVVLAAVSESSLHLIQQRIEDLLRSSVVCESRKGMMVIKLQIANAKPWLRLKVRASGTSSTLNPFYPAYADSENV